MSYSFAPYQDEEPELERSKPPSSRITSPSPRSPPPVQSPRTRPQQVTRNVSEVQPLPDPRTFLSEEQQNHAGRTASEQRLHNLEAFETSLPMRLDYEAVLAYVFPPATGVFLLIFEHKSDYVRFHAWQSSMVFTVVFLLHLLFSWSKILSWIIFALDVLVIAFLAQHAYRDVDTLDHFEVPFFGRLANSFVDDE